MASIDRADWHYGGDYPKELPIENGGTHIGMFINWIIDNDFRNYFFTCLRLEPKIFSLRTVPFTTTQFCQTI